MRRSALTVAGALAVVAPMLLPAHGTLASWSDYKVAAESASAGVWAPDPPAACGPISDYDGGVVYLTPHDDVWPADGQPPTSNHRQIIMGYGGNDTIYAGNSGDCIVGGPGNDTLYGGNAKDIILGGDGDDMLSGGNGIDTLDGGAGTDTCVGGHAPDIAVNCETTP
jgi:hypothetical protein